MVINAEGFFVVGFFGFLFVGFFFPRDVGGIKYSHGVYLYIDLITPGQMLHSSILRRSIWIKTMPSPPPFWGLPHLRGGMKERKWNSSSSSDVLFSSVGRRIICSGLGGGRLCLWGKVKLRGERLQWQIVKHCWIQTSWTMASSTASLMLCISHQLVWKAFK